MTLSLNMSIYRMDLMPHQDFAETGEQMFDMSRDVVATVVDDAAGYLQWMDANRRELIAIGDAYTESIRETYESVSI